MKKTSPIDAAINRHLDEMKYWGPDEPEYHQLISDLRVLGEVKSNIDPASPKFDKNSLVAAGSSLAGILAVLHFEKIGVVASKAFTLVTKLRL